MTLADGAAAQQPARRPTAARAPFERELVGGRRPNVPGLTSHRFFESEWGWLAVEDSADAGPIIARVRTAIARFERIFGKPVERGLLVIKGAKADSVEDTFRRRYGARWTWWQDAFPPASNKTNRELAIDFVVHENAHAWFKQAYQWPVGKNGSASAPDWLNEMVSLLMETQRHRHDHHKELPSVFSEQYFVPLDSLFTMIHPVNAVMVGRAKSYTILAFYAQLGRMSDFFLERSVDPSIFRSITENYVRGSDMSEWLRTTGPRYNLPTTIAELDQEWRRWFAMHRPDPKPATP